MEHIVHLAAAHFVKTVSPTSAKNVQGGNRFIQLTDDSEKVPDLQGKSYTDFCLNRKEWDKLELIHEVLQVSSS